MNTQRIHRFCLALMVMAMLVKELRTFWKKDILLFDVCMEMTVLRQYHFNWKE